MPMPQFPLPIVVIISRAGSHVRALIDAIRNDRLPARIRAVIGNCPDAGGLAYAADVGIPAHRLDHRAFPSRMEFEHALATLIDSYAPGLIVLAWFNRILTPEFVERYRGRLLNIHPSLLPAFRGFHPIEQALSAGAAEHGATVHFVTPEVDGGPRIVQARVPVLPGDTVDTLSARVREQGRRILPEAVRWFAEGRLRWVDGEAWLDGRPLREPVRL
jgi:phosphoribosylglycinamide formyltransferase-1